MMSAAEVSADHLASCLARELKDCCLFGMGGENMRSAGVDIRIDITEKSSVGIIEALKHIPSHLSTLKALKNMLKEEKPDALILVDAQGFNMPLASYAKSLGIKTVYFIAPQEWLWGTKKGVEKVAKTIDLIISIFKKEHDTYKAAGGNSVYYGHPLLDAAKPSMTRDGFFRKFSLIPGQKVVALCPGSRSHEIKSLLPVLMEVAGRIKEAQFVLPISSSKFKQRIEAEISKSALNIKVIEGHNYDVLAYSDLVIAKSGTIVLESVCLKTPVIMFYKLSPITYFIGKYLLGIKLKYYSMPNILAGRMIIPEYVMWQATADNIYSESIKVLDDPEKAKAGYEEVRSILGQAGSLKKTAQKIIEFIRGREYNPQQ
jgi:lipid-A-disaccharide synthase